MNTPAIWTRPDLQFPPVLDTLFFDVDGVLIRTTDSFRAADIAVAEYIVGTIHGLDWGQDKGHPLLTQDDIEAFKRAGGFNDDFTMSYLLASIFTARWREWRGTELAERSMSEWAELARQAMLQGRGSRVWVEDTIPASARADFDLVYDLCLEFYWGAEELRQRFGREPRYVPQAEGFVHNETMLFAPDFFTRLRAQGITSMGMITGRVGPEVDSALDRLAAYSGTRWWDVVISADHYSKPDPAALRAALKATKTQGGLYIGDTADDLDLVLNYRATQDAGEPPMLAAMTVHADAGPLYQQRGADLIMPSVEGLLTGLPIKIQD